MESLNRHSVHNHFSVVAILTTDMAILQSYNLFKRLFFVALSILGVSQ